MELVAAMEKDSGITLKELKVDGGACRDSFLMQFQSDILNKPVCRPCIRETTALGAACLAGLAVGLWKSREEIKQKWDCDVIFRPEMTEEKRKNLVAGWKKAVGRSLDWA
jgi:glycerol kinase